MRHPTPPIPVTRNLRRTLLCLSSALCLPSAWAILGQPLPAPSSATPNNLYTTQITLLDTGTQITQYATPSGVVFALAWQGPILPPLETLLGSYFSNFQAQADASRAQRSIGSPLHIQTDTLVVHSSGRMRNFSGHAYDPQRVPKGLDIHAVFP